MSLFFKHFHKTPFWTQLLLGMVAIFALPEMQANHSAENEQQTEINQSVIQYAQSYLDNEQQPFFVAELNQELLEIKPQAVKFFEFFAKSYRFDNQNIYPIRAGPFA